MIKVTAWGLLAFLALVIPARASSANVFPFPAKIDQLDNGLKIVSVPLGNPDIIAFYTIVRSGSRNEIEPGKSGFAHFFRTYDVQGDPAGAEGRLRRAPDQAGAGTNGFTTDDYTCYYLVFAGRENLEKVVKTEADRFINLYYTRT